MKNVITYAIVLIFVCIGCSEDEDQSQGLGQGQGQEGVEFSPLQANPAPGARNCPSTSSLVGQSRDLQISDLYGIQGVVTIVSDCEIEISNFFYNGDGPNVSVYAGIDGDFDSGVNMSVPLQGQNFEDETLNLFLPEGATFNEFNSISIWCYEFNVNFSSALFQ